VLLALASGLTLSALAMPLWRIQLVAPQYPEGLGMEISARTVRGATEHDLQSINSLNHYIGMKAIEPEEIAELRVIPWLIAGLGVAGLATALIGRRRVAIGWLAAFALTGAVGLWDFHHWEYQYGHDLDYQHAIIKVPGMSYDPPVIGTKQMLNFTATSWPAEGSFAIGAAFAIGVLAVGTKRKSLGAAALVMSAACAAAGPDAILYNADQCAYCHMQISDRRFGAVLVNAHGRSMKFDSIECLHAYYNQAAAKHDVASVWVSDFTHPGTMLSAEAARFVDLGGGRSPMGRGLAALPAQPDTGSSKRWSDL
jgi:copper chaperone NosL